MKRIVLLLAFVALPLLGQPTPEDCFVATKREAMLETATHAGKIYRFKKTGCRALFESDPERYAQLFDTLAESNATGAEVRVEQASLVPS